MSLQQNNPAMEKHLRCKRSHLARVATLPFSKFPDFPKLTIVIVVGTGITRTSTAYELVEQSRKVTLIDSVTHRVRDTQFR